MNKDDHVINAVILGIGVGYLLAPTLGEPTLHAIVLVGIPIVIGALFPDIDTEFGTHRETFHNFVTLAVFLAFPIYFGNLFFVWMGVLTHFVLDLLGTKGGLALFYPATRHVSVPVGVTVDSRKARVVTLAVTGLELGVVWTLVHYGFGNLLRAPGVWDLFTTVF
ncbi:metal-dependent hydrolase [Halorubrum sp. AD140]|uniref:metal-dependent hydrolase n=1 Tax=Halorubrum sp. AD140 TaxID=3050073 RepID=UPI002ACCADCC|nr:metal-dependent hydrolase [Halorubrum sp. AD140]MDZ5811762.1 metal-dependent hydrolase [Halorubrum sp. AD140]